VPYNPILDTEAEASRLVKQAGNHPDPTVRMIARQPVHATNRNRMQMLGDRLEEVGDENHRAVKRVLGQLSDPNRPLPRT
jgi:hypothetical protein